MDPNTLKLLMGSAGAGAVADKLYIEDVFSTWLYTGTQANQTITNGIDLSGKGGLVWLKDRDFGFSFGHGLWDTVRSSSNGNSRRLNSASTASQTSTGEDWISFNSNGFAVNQVGGQYVDSGTKYVSWTFRKAAKFFDVVTFTTGASLSDTNRRIAHSLGSVPGFIILKAVSNPTNWACYHRSTGRNLPLFLNTTSSFTAANYWGTSDPSSTDFGINEASYLSPSTSYVAYLFAHDAGGFGDSGNDNVINCGSYTGNGSTTGPTVTLGWEPQWLLIKSAGSAENWCLFDSLREIATGQADARLLANSSVAENTANEALSVHPLGFKIDTSADIQNTNGVQYIYIAIRRGPMKTPTDATKVFNAVTYTGTGTNSRVYTGAGFPLDAVLINDRLRTSGDSAFVDRLRGAAYLSTASTFSESTGGLFYASKLDSMDGYTGGTSDSAQLNGSGRTLVNYFYRRAPGFFDVVAYAGNNTPRTIAHNLQVAPQLLILKARNSGDAWYVYNESVGATKYLSLNDNSASASAPLWSNTSPTSSVFSVNTGSAVNQSGSNYIAYLFATCPGVSKVGSYTGTGTTLNVDCGFTNGARFVLIKRTDSTGDWYVWDTARGIVAANDPFLLLNSFAAETTGTDYIDPLSTGFQISSTAPAAINASGGSYIYLSVA